MSQVQTRSSARSTSTIVNRSMDDEASNLGENFLPADHGNPDPDPDPDQDCDPNQEPDELVPHLDNFLACLLQLLANKIASIPEAEEYDQALLP